MNANHLSLVEAGSLFARCDTLSLLALPVLGLIARFAGLRSLLVVVRAPRRSLGAAMLLL